MNIQYYGDYCFKITTKPSGRATEDVVIVTDVPEKTTGLRAPQGEAQIVLLSHQPIDAPELEVIKGSPIKLSVPGEYSAKGISILGFQSFRDDKQGELRGQNTIYFFETEEVNICFLGALGSEPAPSIIEKLSGVDVLFVPASGVDTLPVNKVDELVRKIEPKVVIPMHYKISGMTAELPDARAFCDVLGNCPKEALSKWNFKAKDLEGKNMEIVLLDKN